MAAEIRAEEYFDKIIKHLDRKKATLTWGSGGKPVKARHYIDDYLKERDWAMLVVDYNYCHLAVTYCPENRNSYNVRSEKTGVRRQKVVTLFWDENWYAQEYGCPDYGYKNIDIGFYSCPHVESVGLLKMVKI